MESLWSHDFNDRHFCEMTVSYIGCSFFPFLLFSVLRLSGRIVLSAIKLSVLPGQPWTYDHPDSPSQVMK